MRVQVIQDSKGKATGVFIPINEWDKLKKQYEELANMEDEELSKMQLLEEIKQALIELKLVGQGKVKARPIQALLDEL
ncbi:hypothetical protein L0657_01775 [Dyadobacter sp. CY345]|uniref:hypothetical protein n=1 Tax=Dyadobacter sp. CY345 TaxID=2909335 RepID=UPI001F26EA49|nr:hypothetical protein [Dyadobacter sp. CY345]MCF2442668.1 hypothetical protein [Dyadobacter sp. CY345]